MDYRQIVWLSSFPKSGNTWLRCFLDAYLIGEVDINNIISSVTDSGAQRALVGDESDPSTYPVDVQTLTRPMAMLRMVLEYNRNQAETGIKIPLFVKTHSAHLVSNGIELLPESLTKSVIHIVRDPRDVIVSFAKHMGKDMDDAIEFFFRKYAHLHDERKPKMADLISSWPMHTASFSNGDTHNILTVRFEDMKTRPVHTFSKMVKHSGLPVDEKAIEKALEMVKLSKLQKQEEEKGFGESSPHHKDKFFGKGSTGGWVDILTPAQVHKIEKTCSSMMKRFQYQPLVKKKVA